MFKGDSRLEGLRSSKGPKIMGFDLMYGEGLLIRELITLDHSLPDP